jgi:hypothetical protein
MGAIHIMNYTEENYIVRMIACNGGIWFLALRLKHQLYYCGCRSQPKGEQIAHKNFVGALPRETNRIMLR